VRKTVTILLIALLALTLVASACGNKKDEGTPSPTAPPMSAQDILKKATEAGSGIKSSQVGLDMALSVDTSASASPDPSLQVFAQGPVKITGDMATQVEPMAVDGTMSLGMAGQTLSLGIKVVDGLDEAIAHIQEHSTEHSDSILTNDWRHAERFVNEINSAAVFVNASTRFNDGGQFGLE